MAKTEIPTTQIKDEGVTRNDLNVSTMSQAVITKLIEGTNVTLASTGVDAGTGDVTVNASGGAGALFELDVNGDFQPIADPSSSTSGFFELDVNLDIQPRA